MMVLTPVLAGIITFVFFKKHSRRFLIVFQIFMIISAYNILHKVKSEGSYLINLGGWPDGIAITLLADRVSSAMLLMVSIIYLALLFFGNNKKYFTPQFGFLFMTLQGLMMGLFLSSDLFNIFVFVEISTVIVSILIMFNKEKQSIYDGMIYLLVNVVGATFFLFGIGFIYKNFGVLDIRTVSSAVLALEDKNAVILPYAFMMSTLSLKTALMPLFSWLPKAHGTPSAPTVVSAILSGLYIKSGIYIFIRLQEMFYPIIDMKIEFFIVGLLTAVVGFVLALSQRDIKLILAYSTVSQIGVIMMALNIGQEAAYWGGIYHIFNHALFKSTLFLTAGIIIEDYGTRDVYTIRGVFQRMPLTAFTMIFAVLGITGAPLFNGSISKYLISNGTEQLWVTIALTVVNMGTIITFVKFSSILFGKDSREKASDNLFCNVVVVIMGVLCLLSGVFGKQLIHFLFGYSANIKLVSYMVKSISFVIMLLLGIVLYHGVIKRTKLLYKIAAIELSFNGICTAITMYFIGMIIYLNFV